MTLVILTTGCRDWTDREAIANALHDAIVDANHPVEAAVIHGHCPTGADRIADEVATEMGFSVHSMPAEWDKYKTPSDPGGKKAGPIRNRQMVEAAIAIRNLNHGRAICLAFWDGESRGTWNCIQEAVRAGLPVRIVPKRELPALPLERNVAPNPR